MSFAQLGLLELKFQHGTGSGKKQSVWNKNEQNFAIRGCFQVILRIYFSIFFHYGRTRIKLAELSLLFGHTEADIHATQAALHVGKRNFKNFNLMGALF